MHILVTAGNTQAPIDRVRCLTNIFTGKTGASIALAAHRRGHQVTLLTSQPHVLAELQRPPLDLALRWAVHTYRSFADLEALMTAHIRNSPPAVVIHSAAVSDYLVTGVYAPAEGTHLAATGQWLAHGTGPRLVDRTAGKIKSDEPELWLRLARAPKLVDRIRADWGFSGLLVKFKLEVGLDDPSLIEIAERSRRHCGADLMVANTLEGAAEYAFLGPCHGSYQRVPRADLPTRLLDALDALERAGEGPHGE